MKQTRVVFKPIGVIRSEHTVAEKTPIQPVFAKGCRGRVEILPEYAEGLCDVEGFSHIYLIYVFHKAGPPKLIVKPFLQDVDHGIFAIRGPCRPNPVGLSIVRLIRREGNVLYLDGLDVLDGTPLLDIKPYTIKFDRIETTRNGWQDEVDEETAQRKGRRGYRKEATDMRKKTAEYKCTSRQQVEPTKCSVSRITKCHGNVKRHPCEAKKSRPTANTWTTHQSRYELLLKRMVGVAGDSGYVLNPDKVRVKKVLGLMTKNLVATGKPYCPCKQSDPINPKKDVTCPCRDWKEEIKKDGHCFCRLFYRKPAGGQTHRSPCKRVIKEVKQ